MAKAVLLLICRQDLSEVLVIGDDEAVQILLPADLLAPGRTWTRQSSDIYYHRRTYLNLVHFAIEQQLKQLPRADIAQKSLENSKMKDVTYAKAIAF